MKTYLTIAAILATSLGITNLATAHGGGGGGFGGGGHFGGGGGVHFGGGGTHFSALPAMGHFSAPAPVAHFSAPAPTVHFSVPAAVGHSSAPAATAPAIAGQFAARDSHGSVRDDRDRHDHDRDRDRHRREFWGGDWPYYYGDWSYWGSDDSTPYYSGSDSTVVVVQKALAREGYYHGPIDGTLDLITQDAIAKYDRDHHLPVTHTINQPLLSSLRIG